MFSVRDLTEEPPAPPPPAPLSATVPFATEMPYEVAPFEMYGGRVAHQKIFRASGGSRMLGPMLTSEEMTVFGVVCHLRAENERLQSENERLQAVLDGRASSDRPNLASVLAADMISFAQGLAARPVVTPFPPANSESADGFIVPPVVPSNCSELEPNGVPLQDELEVGEIPDVASNTEQLEGDEPLTIPADPDAAEPAPGSKRAAAEAALLQTPNDSNVAIGKRIGCSHELVRLARKDLEASGRLQPVSPPE